MNLVQFVKIKILAILIIIGTLSSCASLVSRVDYDLPKGSLMVGIIDVVETQRVSLLIPYRSFDELTNTFGIREFKGSFCSDLSTTELTKKVKNLCRLNSGELVNKRCLTPDPTLYVDIRRNGRCDYGPKFSILAIERIDAPDVMWLRKLNEQNSRNWLEEVM